MRHLRFVSLFVFALCMAAPTGAQDVPETSLDALRAFTTGMEQYRNSAWRPSLEHFYRAHEIDPDFVVALLFAAVNHFNLGELALADSLMDVVASSRDRLSDYYRYRLESMKALNNGDLQAAYEANRFQALRAPGTKAVYNLALIAIWVNRPQEAVDALVTLDPEREPMLGWLSYWAQLTFAHRMLEQHDRELEAARRARALHPGVIDPFVYEARALAALGRMVELDSVLVDAASFEPAGEYGPVPAMVNAAIVLIGDGRSTDAQRLLDRAIEWLNGRTEDEAAVAGHRSWHAWALLNAERWDEARGYYQGLADESPENIGWRGLLGVAAARSGDREDADRVNQWLTELDQPYIRQSYSEGGSYFAGYADPANFKELRDYPSFQEFLRPRG
jgi:tetratricopeptide (TPR) repeat protein